MHFIQVVEKENYTMFFFFEKNKNKTKQNKKKTIQFSPA